MEDMVKAICYLTGDNYNKFGSLRHFIRYNIHLHTANEIEFIENDNRLTWRSDELYKQGIPFEVKRHNIVYGEKFEWAYFTVRAYKKGTMHFEFTDEKIWQQFNQAVAKIKGYPLPEKTKQPKQQQTAEILFTI